MHPRSTCKSVTPSTDSDSDTSDISQTGLTGQDPYQRSHGARLEVAQLLGHVRRKMASLQPESGGPSLSSDSPTQSRSKKNSVEEKQPLLDYQNQQQTLKKQQQQQHPLFNIVEPEENPRQDPSHKLRQCTASTSVDVSPNNEWNPDYQPQQSHQPEQQPLHYQQQQQHQHPLHQHQSRQQQPPHDQQQHQRTPYKMFSFRSRALSLDRADAGRKTNSASQEQQSRRARSEGRSQRQPLGEVDVPEVAQCASSSRSSEGDRFMAASAVLSSTASSQAQKEDRPGPTSPLLGSWRSDEADNWDELLKAAGVGVIARRVSKAMVSYEYISLSLEGKWSIKMNNALSSFESGFHLNEVYEEENFDGKKCRAIAILDQTGRVLTIKQTALEKDGVAYCIVRELQDDSHMHATVTCLTSGVVAKKYFVRIRNKSNNH